MITEISRMRLF